MALLLAAPAFVGKTYQVTGIEVKDGKAKGEAKGKK